jgi:hypothetical protein
LSPDAKFELGHGNQMRMKILPPTSASKLIRHSRSALQRAVMSADHAPDAGCGGVVDGWSSVCMWRCLLQMKNRSGCAQGTLRFQGFPLERD